MHPGAAICNGDLGWLPVLARWGQPRRWGRPAIPPHSGRSLRGAVGL